MVKDINMLKGILSESKGYYLDIKKKIIRNIGKLPAGSAKERIISGKKYYYLQQRNGNKVVHKYLGKDKPSNIIKQIQERKALKAELKKVNESLGIIKRSEGKKRA